MHPVQRVVLSWYRDNGRDLVWRNTQDPYKILVSEIMLQQTQVDRVIPKYEAFLEQFPDVDSLAEGKTADVLRLWSGLGYNRRALNLQRAAQEIARLKEFPKTLKELQSLPGIGPYTSAAVLSFAFNKDVVVIDTNIDRIFRRVFFEKFSTIEAIAQWILPKGHSRDWHNALMDIGSLFCSPKKPACDVCPLFDSCASASDEERISATWKKKKVQAFKDSKRIVRGEILKALTRDSIHDIENIIARLRAKGINRLDAEYMSIIDDLVREGLLVRENEKLFLP